MTDKNKTAAPAERPDDGNNIPEQACKQGCDQMSEDVCPTCSHRKKLRAPEEKKKLLNRLRRIDGQVRGLERMVESDAYCPDILVQASAVNSAMNGFCKELLAEHLRSCVVEDIKDGREDTIDELVELLKKLMK